MEKVSEGEDERLIPTEHPSPDPDLKPKSARAAVPEAEIRLYVRGRGPVEIFRSPLGGWDQDRLEIGDILDRCGLKCLYAFNPESGRGVPIRFTAKNGRSVMSYADGAVVLVDGEPKDSLVKPITKILIGVAVLTLMITLVVKEAPEWLKSSRFSNGSFSPWILACVVIVFTRLRKRTKDFLTKKLVR